MATRSAKEYLQAEIVAALGTSPASGKITTVYKTAELNSVEGMDPRLFPCADVMMPEEQSNEPLCPTMARVTYGVDVWLWQSREDLAQADQDISAIIGAIRVSLGAYDSAGFRRMGIFKGSIQVTDEGAFEGGGNNGQDQLFKVSLVVTCHYNQAVQLDDAS